MSVNSITPTLVIGSPKKGLKTRSKQDLFNLKLTSKANDEPRIIISFITQ